MNRFLFLFIIVVLLIRKLFALNEANDLSYINTKNIIYDNILNTIEFGEDSSLNFNNSIIQANKGIIDYKNDKIEIFGNFYLYQEDTILSGEDLISDLKLENFKSNKISYIYNNDLKVDSFRLEKEKDKLYFYENFLTPCKINGFFNCPTWSLKINKTKYLIKEDKFTHYDSFLQIADNKIFYIPYFTHYGNKAPRKNGFLTPTLEFNILGSGSIIHLPYYIPLKNYTDVLITPRITFLPSITSSYRIDTILNSKLSGGNIKLDFTTIKNKNESDIYNSLKLNTEQVISKNHILSFNGLITNSLSNSRSINDEQISYENAYIKLDSYNLINNNDILITEINTVTAFDNSDSGLVPYVLPNISYSSLNEINKNKYINNVINYSYLRRDKSEANYASEVSKLTVENSLTNHQNINDNVIVNKFKLVNNFKNVFYALYPSNNKSLHEFNLKYSSEINLINKYVKPRIKLILVEDFNTNKSINEDSNSITFNYNNNFQENRFFGNDIIDKSNRIAFGLETFKKLNSKKFDLKLGQSYDFKLNNEYLKNINQNHHFSDYALEARATTEDLIFTINSRIDYQSFTKKEMNYILNLKKYGLEIEFNETSNKAFKSNSDNSKSLKINLSKKLNENLNFYTNTNLDLNNNYNPYETNLTLSLYDECSQLDISYHNTKYSDNFITTPSETISLTFRMDYLGFFGYEQNADLFLKKQGEFNYGSVKN